MTASMSQSQSTLLGAFVRNPVDFLCNEPVVQASHRTSLKPLSLGDNFMKGISQMREFHGFSVEEKPPFSMTTLARRNERLAI